MIDNMKLIPCIAWAACAIGYAVPADANAVTLQVGNYAACSNAYETRSGEWCYVPDIGGPMHYTFYKQQIKFLNQGCNTGEGCLQNGDVFTDTIYSTGRKPATLYDYCGGANVYGLGSCAC
jgi:hypothetical protein